MVLSVEIQQQLLPHWCWAAVASSINLFYVNAEGWTQTALAGTLIDAECALIDPNKIQEAPASCDRIAELSSALSLTRNLAWDETGHLTLVQIQSQISQGWPICCEINWPGFDLSHYIIIYGFNDSLLIIGDPELGEQTLSYDELVAGYRQGDWVRTFGTTAGPAT